MAHVLIVQITPVDQIINTKFQISSYKCLKKIIIIISILVFTTAAESTEAVMLSSHQNALRSIFIYIFNICISFLKF